VTTEYPRYVSELYVMKTEEHVTRVPVDQASPAVTARNTRGW